MGKKKGGKKRKQQQQQEEVVSKTWAVKTKEELVDAFMRAERGLVMVGVTFSVLGHVWEQVCGRIRNAVLAGLPVTIIASDYLSSLSRSMDFSVEGHDRLTTLLAVLCELKDCPNLEVYLVNCHLYSTFFYFGEDSVFRIAHTHGGSTSEGTIIEVPEGDIEHGCILSDVQFLEASPSTRKIHGEALIYEHECYVDGRELQGWCWRSVTAPVGEWEEELIDDPGPEALCL